MDVGVISDGSGEEHYFINIVDIHLSAKAGFYASRYKRFSNLCYVIGALQAFMEHYNQENYKVYGYLTTCCTEGKDQYVKYNNNSATVMPWRKIPRSKWLLNVSRMNPSRACMNQKLPAWAH